MVQRQVINASVSPKGSLETLSQREVQQLSEVGSGSSYTLFRQCVLAILNTGAHRDNATLRRLHCHHRHSLAPLPLFPSLLDIIHAHVGAIATYTATATAIIAVLITTIIHCMYRHAHLSASTASDAAFSES